MIKKTAISTTNAPSALGPYSQAIQSDEMIFASGQLGINPANKELPESVEEQAKQSLQNISKILEAANCDINHVLKTTVYMTDIKDFAAVNEIYGEFFAQPYPARSAIQVAALPAGAKIEIEVIAKK